MPERTPTTTPATTHSDGEVTSPARDRNSTQIASSADRAPNRAPKEQGAGGGSAQATATPPGAAPATVTGVSADALQFDMAPADRFVESRSLVPLQIITPEGQNALAPHQALAVVAVLSKAAIMPDFNPDVLEDMVTRLRLQSLARLAADPEPLPNYRDPWQSALRGARVPSERTPGPQTNSQQRRDPKDESSADRSARYSEIRADAGDDFAPAVAALTSTHLQKAEVTLGQVLQSDVGVLFMDRTRIRPAGFAPGEHLTTLSLAPGEEVTVEQHSFSKREATYEDMNETEQSFDLEMASTVTTALDEGMNRSEQESTTSGWNVGGSLGGEFKGVRVGVQGGFSSSVTEADQLTSTRSRNDSWSASQKVASKYRAQHKTTLKLATEQRFEVTNRRVLRNPNRYTPIHLHYFKVQQRLRLSHERYGVQLCWAPFIPDPAMGVIERILMAAQEIRNRNEPLLPSPPLQPTPPPGREPQEVISDVVSVDNTVWGISVEVPVSVEIPADYVWDGDSGFVKSSLTASFVQCAGWAAVQGEPAMVVGRPTAWVHIGTDAWGKGRVNVQIKARCVPAPSAEDAEYRQRFQEWQQATKAWQRQCATLRAEADAKTEAQIRALETSVWEQLDGTSELMQRIVSSLWPMACRDSGQEIDTWRQLFEWEAAGYELFPGWWLDRPLRAPHLTPTHFRNASWARTYLPMRPGREAEALAFIYTGGNPAALTSELEQAITKTVTMLEEHRLKHFGSTTGGPVTSDDDCPQLSEKVTCLGTWEELLPTDGTHVEVTVSPTNAADDLSRAEMHDAATRRAADLQQTEAVTTQIKQAAKGNINITVHMGQDPDAP
ncbi:hypothetical protein [Arthrobacter sp. ISL-30]|uniref:hypothetical protein n=1 Tax=Arthrobacter sp. ISL-30 TaxID=2819109 RepID=UPI001BE91EED|nr:hypothetical protein [Arthrobacter sp. ISL-30]MBT2515802.1 hypothetical protein [Arthrobacter sp. ISL-30]